MDGSAQHTDPHPPPDPPPAPRGRVPTTLRRSPPSPGQLRPLPMLSPRPVARIDAGPGGSASALRRPISTATVVAVAAVGGGAGRTTVSVGLAQLFALVRQHPVAVVEALAAPLGAMGERIPTADVVSLLDFAASTPEAAGGTPVPVPAHRGDVVALVGDRPAAGRFTRAATADTVIRRLGTWYPLVVVDVATAVTEPGGWWRRIRPENSAAVVVVCRSAAADLRLLSETLPVLAHAGGLDLDRLVVVANAVIPGAPDRAARVAEQLVAAQTPRVLRLPFDPGLAAGRPVRLTGLRRGTRAALIRVASACATHFG